MMANRIDSTKAFHMDTQGKNEMPVPLADILRGFLTKRSIGDEPSPTTCDASQESVPGLSLFFSLHRRSVSLRFTTAMNADDVITLDTEERLRQLVTNGVRYWSVDWSRPISND